MNGRYSFSIASSLILLLALTHMPYGYYTLLRIVLCIWGITYGVACAAEEKSRGYAIIPYGIAILYNPLIPVHLTRGTWNIINLATIPFIILITVQLTRSRKQPQ